MGLIGAALFYGDAAITPAISVLSAVEGLRLVTSRLDAYVLPITIVIIVGAVPGAVPRHGSGGKPVWPDHPGVVCGDGVSAALCTSPPIPRFWPL